MRFKTVVSYGAKQTDDVLGYGKKTNRFGVLTLGITVVFVIKTQLFWKLWIVFNYSVYHLLVKVHSFPRQQIIFKCVIFLGIFSLSLEYM